MAKSEITFFAAKQDKYNTSLRQAYLDTIMPSCSESVPGIIYDPHHLLTIDYVKKLFNEKSLTKEDVESIINYSYDSDASASVIFPHQLLGTGKKHPIFVFSAAFNGFDSEASILNLLLDHEALHANDLRYGIKLPHNILLDYSNIDKFDSRIPWLISELYAHNNQLKNLEKRGITRNSTKDILLDKIGYFTKFLHSTVPKTDMEKLIISSF